MTCAVDRCWQRVNRMSDNKESLNENHGWLMTKNVSHVTSDRKNEKMSSVTHLEVQQREDIRRDLPERVKFVPPDFRTWESVFYWQEDPSKIQQGLKFGKWLKVEILAVKGSIHGCYHHWCIHFSSKCKQTKKTFGHSGVGRPSRFAWADKSICSAAFLCWSNRCLGTVLWQFFFMCYPRSTKIFGDSPSWSQNWKHRKLLATVISGLLVKAQRKNPKIVVMSPTTTSQNSKQKEVKFFKERLRHRKVWEMRSREKALFREIITSKLWEHRLQLS